MELRDHATDDFLALSLCGYQFERVTDQWDSNWLLMQIDGSLNGRSWTTTDPCLDTFEVEALARWLLAAADAPVTLEPLGFTEPRLSFELADARGRTVYVLTKPGMQNVPCTDASGCTAVWPDLPLPDGTKHATAGAEVNAMILGTMKVGNETYPTYNGYLMYEYASDTGPRQTNGQGITSYGGTWYVINPSGKPTKTGTSGGGYHY